MGTLDVADGFTSNSEVLLWYVPIDTGVTPCIIAGSLDLILIEIPCRTPEYQIFLHQPPEIKRHVNF